MVPRNAKFRLLEHATPWNATDCVDSGTPVQGAQKGGQDSERLAGASILEGLSAATWLS